MRNNFFLRHTAPRTSTTTITASIGATMDTTSHREELPVDSSSRPLPMEAVEVGRKTRASTGCPVELLTRRRHRAELTKSSIRFESKPRRKLFLQSALSTNRSTALHHCDPPRPSGNAVRSANIRKKRVDCASVRVRWSLASNFLQQYPFESSGEHHCN